MNVVTPAIVSRASVVPLLGEAEAPAEPGLELLGARCSLEARC